MNGTGLPDRSLGPRSSSRHHSLPPSHNNDIYDDARHPQGLPFLGPLPSSNAYAERAFDGWNVSPEGCFPLQPLRGPGQFGDPLPSTARQPFPPTSDPIPPATVNAFLRFGSLPSVSTNLFRFSITSPEPNFALVRSLNFCSTQSVQELARQLPEKLAKPKGAKRTPKGYPVYRQSGKVGPVVEHMTE